MKAKIVLLQLLLVASASVFAPCAGAAMYKWTDKEGNVQYTETPPPEGDATEIAPPPRVAAPASAKAEKNGANDAEGDKTKSAGEEEKLTPEQLEIYKRNCEAARGNLETYRTARRVQQADGEIIVMDDEKRQQKIQQAEEQIQKFCK